MFINQTVEMNIPNFPPRKSSGFRAITSHCEIVAKYIDVMQGRRESSLKERVNLLHSIVNESSNGNRFCFYTPGELKPEFTIEERNSDLLDMSDDEILLAVPDAHYTAIDELVEKSNDDDNKNEADKVEPAAPLLSVEDLGDQTQSDLLDLKAALHQENSEIDVGILFLEGPTASDRLACVADDLSRLPTKQVTKLLKSFMASDTTRMLQQDLALIGRHLLFTHLKHLEAFPGTLLISCLSEFASKWPQVFMESVLQPTLMDLDRDPLVQTLNKVLKTFGCSQSLWTLELLLKNLVKLVRKDDIQDLQKLKMINTVLGFMEILLSNTTVIPTEVLNHLRLLYNDHQLELNKSRLFAKVILDSVKRVSKLGNLKAFISDLVSAMDHPMKNVIRKVATSKP
ncbi:uncharacterized protein LOC111251949 isoform X2 [Varroa destructor]|uniref:Fanconi Anaemia group E protein C-terminal domain-containing protein n=1 Tax=Varroa destructor TaxID=109461 RepID=A0A7M7MBU1_VARDE|nr:uncharacterized protein LOC111251949 isoform X2 [Varroa destructor]